MGTEFLLISPLRVYFEYDSAVNKKLTALSFLGMTTS